MAHAGPNWACRNCGGTQRRPDGSCRNCGASQEEAEAERRSTRLRKKSVPTPEPDAFSDSWEPESTRSRAMPVVGMFLIAVLGMLVVGGILWILFTKRDVDLTVASVSWEHVVKVERYTKIPDEGFKEDMPSDAGDVQREGDRLHHHEQVFDHYEKEHSSDKQKVGEDCYDVPPTCRTVPGSCSANDNGTATCSDPTEVCSGGGRSCDPVYEDVPCVHDKEVYRDEPVYEPYYSWTVWRWKPERKVSLTGSTVKTEWPSDERVCLDCRVGPGERERESGRKAWYTVKFTEDSSGKTYTHKPDSDAAFKQFPVGSTHEAKYSIAGGLDFSATQ